MRSPSGETWTLEDFTTGAKTSGVWSIANLSQVLENERLDGEYYQPLYLRYAEKVSDGEKLGKTTDIMHPAEIKRVYSESGVHFLLAQNIRNNRLDFSTTSYMPHDVVDKIARNRLIPNDVVMTRSGANFGDAAVYKGTPTEIYASADCLIIRPEDIPGGYLATYFNTKIGRALITRGMYGMAQPHIAPNYLNTMCLPRFERDFELGTDRLVEEAYEQERRSKVLYDEAQAMLLADLELDDLSLSLQSTYTQSSTKVWNSGRLDAEYFQPKYQRALENISVSGKSINDVVTLAKRRFEPTPTKQFEYIQIGDVGWAGHAESKTLLGEEAPSRARWIVKAGDVITSTVRPIRRLSALIETEQDGYVCSSGFAVLTPTDIEPEVLLIYLRLPIVCEIMDLYTSASMYPAISKSDLLQLPAPIPRPETRNKVVGLVRKSQQARQESKRLLEEAQRRVEERILTEGSL